MIRLMTFNDLDEIVIIEKLCSALPWGPSFFTQGLKCESGASYLGDRMEGRLRGFIGLQRVADELHITNLAVSPDFRRQGVAQGLLRLAMRQATESGAAKATLEVRAGNMVARSLYEKEGFDYLALRRSYYVDNQEDAMVMGCMDMASRISGSSVI